MGFRVLVLIVDLVGKKIWFVFDIVGDKMEEDLVLLVFFFWILGFRGFFCRDDLIFLRILFKVFMLFFVFIVNFNGWIVGVIYGFVLIIGFVCFCDVDGINMFFIVGFFLKLM